MIDKTKNLEKEVLGSIDNPGCSVCNLPAEWVGPCSAKCEKKEKALWDEREARGLCISCGGKVMKEAKKIQKSRYYCKECLNKSKTATMILSNRLEKAKEYTKEDFEE